MRKPLIFLLSLFSAARFGIAGEQQIPTHRILAEDVVQDSVRQSRMTTNKYSVRWTYTEAGARKVLAFHEAHEGQKVREVIGAYESPLGEMIFRPMPPTFTNYTQWKEGWLNYRTDKVYSVSEDDAKKIVAGLQGR